MSQTQKSKKQRETLRSERLYTDSHTVQVDAAKANTGGLFSFGVAAP
tara:strand:- start:1620 stop:1760 length:141 start_codon:yes stop_codon:yes gene_type:complete